MIVDWHDVSLKRAFTADGYDILNKDCSKHFGYISANLRQYYIKVDDTKIDYSSSDEEVEYIRLLCIC